MKKGDRVKFINDTSVGIVTKIEGSTIYVDVVDGFEIPTIESELVVVNEQDELDALNRIGTGDEKPGRRGNKPAKAANEGVKKTPATREPSYKKYGRIALINDEEEEDTEDEEVVFDVHEMKEKYLKTLALRRQREAEMEAEKKTLQREKEKTVEQSEPAPVAPFKEADAPKPAPKPLEEKKDEPEIVDLHAEEILGTTEGLTSGQIIEAQLARFTFTLDTLVSGKKHGKIIFIHGVGKGKLKFEMLKILKNDYKKMDYQDASFKEYGYGAIIVYY